MLSPFWRQFTIATAIVLAGLLDALLLLSLALPAFAVLTSGAVHAALLGLFCVVVTLNALDEADSSSTANSRLEAAQLGLINRLNLQSLALERKARLLDAQLKKKKRRRSSGLQLQLPLPLPLPDSPSSSSLVVRSPVVSI